MSVTADKAGWRLLPLSTRSSMTPDRGPLYRPGGGVLRSGGDVTLGTGLQWSGARQTPSEGGAGFYGRGWCFGWAVSSYPRWGSLAVRGHDRSPVDAGFAVTPDGCPVRDARNASRGPLHGHLRVVMEGGASPGGRRSYRGQACVSVWVWRESRGQGSGSNLFVGSQAVAGPVVGKPGAGVPGSWPPPGPGRVPPVIS